MSTSSAFELFFQHAIPLQCPTRLSQGNLISLSIKHYQQTVFVEDIDGLVGVGEMKSVIGRYFGKKVRATLVMTPPKSQGVPPHWDCFDAVVAQLDGAKAWKFYEPIVKEPVKSSGPLIVGDKPDVELLLISGDLLYYPRGWIHETNTFDSEKPSVAILFAIQSHLA